MAPKLESIPGVGWLVGIGCALIIVGMIVAAVPNQTLTQKTNNTSATPTQLGCGDGQFININSSDQVKFTINPGNCWTPWILRPRGATLFGVRVSSPITERFSYSNGEIIQIEDSPLLRGSLAKSKLIVTGVSFLNTSPSPVSVVIYFRN